MTTYREAGVDVAAGDESVRRISSLVSRTFTDEVMEGLGGFGSLFRLDTTSLSDPVLVSTTDGVGTKTQLARRLGDLSTLGWDLVAMCVDDLACVGAKPLFFLDYLAIGRQYPPRVEELVGGIADACLEAKVALIGGETAEHPGVMEEDDLDIAGFVVGVVERELMWGSERVEAGDVLIGLPSPNLRSNGFSLVRAVFHNIIHGAEPLSHDERSLLQRLCAPSVLYSPKLQLLSGEVRRTIHAAAHITGGGLLANLQRVIPSGLCATVDRESWEVPSVFSLVEDGGAISSSEMFKTFNMGIGMVLVVDQSADREVLDALSSVGLEAVSIGRVDAAARGDLRARFLNGDSE